MKYNKKKVEHVSTTSTFEGGTAIKQKDEIALLSLLATGLDSKFYEMESEREKRLIDLVASVSKKDKYLVAQMIVYTRAILGQRSITHRAAVELARHLKGEDWGKRFFDKWNRKDGKGGVIFRLDDVLEIAACYFALNGGKNLSNAIKKGFASAISKADAYELAKYKGDGKDVSLVDIVNLVHPIANKHNEDALKQLIAGTLKQHDTVEDKNTEAGKVVAEKVKAGKITKAEAEVELKEAKTENFRELIETKAIGYIALLRNLRNILKADEKLIADAGVLLTDPKFVRKSLVLPIQIDMAYEVISDEFNSAAGRVLKGYLNKSYELAIPNISDLGFEGTTAIVFDSSGSMTSTQVGGKFGRRIMVAEKAALIAATLAKGTNGDVYTFSTSCQKLKYDGSDSVFTIKDTFERSMHGGGTAFNSIFRTLDRAYDRVFIISDMQGADELIGRGSAYEAYKSKYGIDPYIYSVDLAGHGTDMFKQKGKLFYLAGYSAQIFETVKKYETDYNALLNEVRKIEI